MRALKELGIFAALIMTGVLLSAPATARAGLFDDDESSSSSVEEPKSMLGLGVRLRQIYIPEYVIELFLRDAPGTTSHIGYGAEFLREKGNLTISLGVEYEEISAEDGYYVDNDGAIDRVAFKDFRWIGADASFIWQTGIIGRKLFLRYGAGLGLGVLMGEVQQTDYLCPNGVDNPCVQDPNAVDVNSPADLPPVFPIINVIVGLQLRPFENLAINLEGGIRTVPFIGTSAAFLF